MARLVHDGPTAYFQRRLSDGLTKKKAVRCLKRYVARDVFNALPRDRLT